jgi:hypothetical protein
MLGEESTSMGVIVIHKRMSRLRFTTFSAKNPRIVYESFNEFVEIEETTIRKTKTEQNNNKNRTRSYPAKTWRTFRILHLTRWEISNKKTKKKTPQTLISTNQSSAKRSL